MKLAYFSVTGQTRRFVSKTNLPNVEISPDDDIEMNEPFLLITPSYAEESPTVSKSIDVMDPVFDFMAYNDNYKHCLGIIGTGIVISQVFIFLLLKNSLQNTKFRFYMILSLMVHQPMLLTVEKLTTQLDKGAKVTFKNPL